MKEYEVNAKRINDTMMFEVKFHGETKRFPMHFEAMNPPIMDMKVGMAEAIRKPMQVVNFIGSEDNKEYSVLCAFDINEGGESFMSVYDFEADELNTAWDLCTPCECTGKCVDSAFCGTVREVVQEWLKEVL